MNANNMDAHQCPYKGGKAVYKARTMVWLYNPRAKFIDDELCTNGAYFRQTNSENNSTNLYAGGPAVINARNWVRTYDPLYQFDENFLCAGSVYRKKATEIQNVKQELILNVVPNPTSGAISLESNLPMDGTLQIVDLVGKVNGTMELITPLLYINLDFSKLANGSYILIYKSINGTSKHIKFEIIK